MFFLLVAFTSHLPVPALQAETQISVQGPIPGSFVSGVAGVLIGTSGKKPLGMQLARMPITNIFFLGTQRAGICFLNHS